MIQAHRIEHVGDHLDTLGEIEVLHDACCAFNFLVISQAENQLCS